MAYTTQDVHEKIKKLLYSLTGITLTENKDIMISNRIDKLKRNCNNYGDIMELLDSVEKGQNVTEFINTFTTNKTHFFREEFHFEDLRDRVLPAFSKNKENISIWCSASSTGEEPYSIAMTIALGISALLGSALSPLMTTAASLCSKKESYHLINKLLNRSTLYLNIFINFLFVIIILFRYFRLRALICGMG